MNLLVESRKLELVNHVDLFHALAHGTPALRECGSPIVYLCRLKKLGKVLLALARRSVQWQLALQSNDSTEELTGPGLVLLGRQTPSLL